MYDIKNPHFLWLVCFLSYVLSKLNNHSLSQFVFVFFSSIHNHSSGNGKILQTTKREVLGNISLGRNMTSPCAWESKFVV